MSESRRHRLIWLAVAGAHAVALGALAVGGLRSPAEAGREGGVMLVYLSADPIAVPGEVVQGLAVGAGAVRPAPGPLFTPAAEHSAVPSGAIADSVPAGPVAAIVLPSRPMVSAVAEVFTPPSFLVHEEPAYPERARRAGICGEVVLKIILSARGEVRRVELIRSSGSRLLDEAAIEAAQASRFSPAERNHVAVAAEASATYRFELR